MSLLWLFLPLVLFAGVVFLRRYLILKHLYNPGPPPGDDPNALGIEYETIPFLTQDRARLTGWWIPREDAIGTLLLMHGKSGNIGDRLHWVEDLHRLPVNLFLFDYRGYGASRGRPSERGLYHDARAAYEVVRAFHDDADEPPVILYGRSLGGAVALNLALERHVCGVIIENTFSSLHEVAVRKWPHWLIRCCLREHYPNLEYMAALDVPVLQAHSRDDQLIPFEMAQRLHAATRQSQPLVETTGSHDTSGWRSTPSYWPRVETFVLRHLQAAKNSGNISGATP